MTEKMTESDLQAMLATASTFDPRIPAIYGNIMVGIWDCPTAGCCRLVPRELRIALVHKGFEPVAPPFHCPVCNAILEYDEEE